MLHVNVKNAISAYSVFINSRVLTGNGTSLNLAEWFVLAESLIITIIPISTAWGLLGGVCIYGS